MAKRITESFFWESPDTVAKRLLGKMIVRKLNGRIFKARIVEAEAYFGEEDPASWARFGKRKDNFAMWLQGGTILVKNVHKHLMLNFVTGSLGKAEAVLIRALEPINFQCRCSGPGLLTKVLDIRKEFNGVKLSKIKSLWVEDTGEKFRIKRSQRVGVRKDLNVPLRFYIDGSRFISARGK